MLGARILFLFLHDIQNAEKVLNLRSQTNNLEDKDPVIALTQRLGEQGIFSPKTTNDISTVINLGQQQLAPNQVINQLPKFAWDSGLLVIKPGESQANQGHWSLSLPSNNQTVRNFRLSFISVRKISPRYTTEGSDVILYVLGWYLPFYIYLRSFSKESSLLTVPLCSAHDLSQSLLSGVQLQNLWKIFKQQH